MANTPQARKRVRQAEKARRQNASMRSMFRTYVKKVVNAIAAGDRAAAEQAYKDAVPVIDSIARKGLVHKNKAARHKSRLYHHILKLEASAAG